MKIFPGGYDYHYYVTDYLGSIRAVVGLLLAMFIFLALTACNGRQQPDATADCTEACDSCCTEDSFSLHLYYKDREYGYYDFLLNGYELSFVRNDSIVESVVLYDSEMDSIVSIVSELGDVPVFEAEETHDAKECYLVVNGDLAYYCYYPQDSSQWKVTKSLADYLFNLMKYDL